MTAAAKQFVTPLSAAALSGQPVRDDLFVSTDEAEMGHIELSREADLVVVAPATADLIARMAHGLADDLATTTLLATDKRALVAPAMNLRMWLHPATQRNVATLRGDGVLFVGPDDGEMACGEYGPGPDGRTAGDRRGDRSARSPEPTAIPLPPGVGSARRPRGPLAGRHVVVTSGPDPRADRSGALHRQSLFRPAGPCDRARRPSARAQGDLVSGPVDARRSAGRQVVRVETARADARRRRAALPADVFVAAAAVADWRVERRRRARRSRRARDGAPILSLVENPDILAEIAAKSRRPAGARRRLRRRDRKRHRERARQARRKRLRSDRRQQRRRRRRDVRRRPTTRCTIVDADGVERWPRMSKQEVARALDRARRRDIDGRST